MLTTDNYQLTTISDAYMTDTQERFVSLYKKYFNSNVENEKIDEMFMKVAGNVCATLNHKHNGIGKTTDIQFHCQGKTKIHLEAGQGTRDEGRGNEKLKIPLKKQPPEMSEDEYENWKENLDGLGKTSDLLSKAVGNKAKIQNMAEFIFGGKTFDKAKIGVSIDEKFSVLSVIDLNTQTVLGRLDLSNGVIINNEYDMFSGEIEEEKHEKEMTELKNYIESLHAKKEEYSSQGAMFGFGQLKVKSEKLKVEERYYLLKEKAQDKFPELFKKVGKLLNIKEVEITQAIPQEQVLTSENKKDKKDNTELSPVNDDEKLFEEFKLDIPYKTAEQSYRNISMDSEKMAVREQNGYAGDLLDDYKIFKKYLPENELQPEFDKHRSRMKALWLAMLYAKSRTASSFITGPSKFPTQANRKRLDTEQRRFNEMQEYHNKRLKAVKDTNKPETVIRGGEETTLQKLETKLTSLNKRHDEMVEINKLLRKGDVDKLHKLGITDDLIIKLKNPTYSYEKPGFQTWELSNLTTEIRRIEGRIKEEKRRGEKIETQGTSIKYDFDGGYVEENSEANRIQIFFNAIPPYEMRGRLKSKGFHWSPANKAWQRQLTDNAIYETKQLLNINKPEIEIVKQEINEEIHKAIKTLKIVNGKQTQVKTSTVTFEGQYGVMELADLIPSNNPFTFSKNEHYPVYCQTRDYSGDKSEQSKVMRNEKDFDGEILLSDSKFASDGPPIVTKDGVVLGGNSRTMLLYRLKEHQQFNEKYRSLFEDNLSKFKIDFDSVKDFSFPVVVRIIDYKIDSQEKCSEISNALNTDQTQRQSQNAIGVSYGKQLDNHTIERIATIFVNSKYDTFGAVLDERISSDEIIRILREQNVISENNKNEWLTTNNEFNEEGKTKLKALLLGVILPSTELIEAATSYTLKLIPAIPQLLKIKTMPDEWNIVPSIHEALRLEHLRRNTKMKIRDLTSQTSFGEDNELKNVTDRTKWTWIIMDEAGKETFKNVMAQYIMSAENIMHPENSFMPETGTPEEVLEKLSKSKSAMGDEFEETGHGTRDTGNGEEVEITKTQNPEPRTQEEKPSQIVSDVTNEETNTETRQLPKSLNDVLTMQTPDGLKLNKLKHFFGKLLPKSKMLIYGPPGSGKSSFALLLAEELAQNGSVLYFLSEEKLDIGYVKERLKLMKIKNANIHFDDSKDWNNLIDDVNTLKYKFIIVDSINAIDVKQEDFMELAKEFPELSFIFICHTTKDKKTYSGIAALEHEVDDSIMVNDGLAVTMKNRGGMKQEFRIFPSTQISFRKVNNN